MALLECTAAMEMASRASAEEEEGGGDGDRKWGDHTGKFY